MARELAGIGEDGMAAIWQSCAKCTYAMIQLSLPTRVTPASSACAVDGDVLADGIAVADLDGGVLAGVFLVLRGRAESR